jgi:hypothetical protein
MKRCSLEKVDMVIIVVLFFMFRSGLNSVTYLDKVDGSRIKTEANFLK